MIALLDFVEEHRDAVAYDLMQVGHRLREFPSPAVTYGDLAVLIRQAPRGSAIARSEPSTEHSNLLELLRRQEFYLSWLVWAKTKDAEHNRNQPEPYRFPWEPDDDNTIRGDVLDVDEMAARLGWDVKQLT